MKAYVIVPAVILVFFLNNGTKIMSYIMYSLCMKFLLNDFQTQGPISWPPLLISTLVGFSSFSQVSLAGRRFFFFQSDCEDKSSPEAGACLECRLLGKQHLPVLQVIRKGEVSCCWICTACKENEFVQDEFTCRACDLGWWPNAELTGRTRLAHNPVLLISKAPHPAVSLH